MKPRILGLLLCLLLLAGCQDSGWIVLQNESSLDVVFVSIDPCDADPGPNRLGTGRIASGEREMFSVAFGCYDVLALTVEDFPGIWRVNVNSRDRMVTLIVAPPTQP